MKLKNKLILSSINYLTCSAISMSCVYKEHQDELKKLNNSNLQNKNKIYEIIIDGQKYSYENINDFVKNFDIESRTKNMLAIGDYSINDEKRFLNNEKEYMILDENAFKKLYKTKYNENVENIEDAYQSYLEDFAIVQKFFASNKDFDSFNDAKNFNIDKIKKGIETYCYYYNKDNKIYSKEIDPFSEKSANDFLDSYIKKLTNKSANEINEEEFKNYYLCDIKNENNDEIEISTKEKFNLKHIVRKIFENVKKAISYKIEICLTKDLGSKPLKFESNDMGYKFILNEEQKNKGWKLNEEDLIIYNEWDFDKWKTFLSNLKEKKLIDVSNDNFETQEEKQKINDLKYVKKFLGTNIKNIFDINDLKVKTNKFIRDTYTEDWRYLIWYFQNIISDFYIGTKFGNEEYGLGIKVNIKRNIDISKILKNLEISSNIKKNMDFQLNEFYIELINKISKNELDLFVSSVKIEGHTNNNEIISNVDNEINIKEILIKNLKKIEKDVFNSIKKHFKNIIKKSFTKNISKSNTVNFLINEENYNDYHFLFLNNKNISFFETQKNLKNDLILIKSKKTEEIKNMNEINFNNSLEKHEEENFLNICFFNVSKKHPENKNLKKYMPLVFKGKNFRLKKFYILYDDLLNFQKDNELPVFVGENKKIFIEKITDFYKNKFLPSKKYKLIIPKNKDKIFFNSKELLLSNIYNCLKIKSSKEYLWNIKISKNYKNKIFNIYRFEINNQHFDFLTYNDINLFFKKFVLQNSKIK